MKRILCAIIGGWILAGGLLCAQTSIGPASEVFHKDALEIQLSSGAQWGLNNPNGYVWLPQSLTVGWTLDDVGNPGWRSGVTQLRASVFGTPILSDTTVTAETRAFGGAVGPFYHFVQPGWKTIPYLGAQLGFLCIDSTGIREGQGQDFCFTTLVTLGVRQLLTNRWSVSVEGVWQHVSNGGLSEPDRKNVGLDTVGPRAGLSYHF